MLTELIFDVETQKIFDEIEGNDPGSLGVSLASVYLRKLDDNFNEISGQIYSFFEPDLSKMWTLFSNVDRCIGFNTLKFDIPALKPYCPFDLKKLNHLDILDQVKQVLGYRLSLDSLTTTTLGTSKIDSGLNAVIYWNEHSPESLAKLKKYCEADVLVTRDLYDYGLKNGQLKYIDKWNTPRIIEVDFSYPKSDIHGSQIGLF